MSNPLQDAPANCLHSRKDKILALLQLPNFIYIGRMIKLITKYQYEDAMASRRLLDINKGFIDDDDDDEDADRFCESNFLKRTTNIDINRQTVQNY